MPHYTTGTDALPANRRIADAIYREHQPEVFAYLRKRLRDDQTAMDIAQEAFARIVSAKRGYEDSQGRSLIFRIAHNLFIDHVRSMKSKRVAEDGLLTLLPKCDAVTPDRVVQGREDIARVREAILDLPARCREVFVLNRFEGMSYAAIAEHCGISQSVVEKHMQKALSRLAAVMER